jgi:tetratricopeptide (TPR) repeat protein
MSSAADPNLKLARTMHFNELQRLRGLTDFERLVEACNQFKPPLSVSAEEEKKMRRHMKYKNRTELDITLMSEVQCCQQLRERLLKLVNPIYDQKVDQAVTQAARAIRSAKTKLQNAETGLEQLLTELDSCLRDPATQLLHPGRKDMASDLYYFRALILARSGRMELALADLSEGIRIDPVRSSCPPPPTTHESYIRYVTNVF